MESFNDAARDAQLADFLKQQQEAVQADKEAKARKKAMQEAEKALRAKQRAEKESAQAAYATAKRSLREEKLEADKKAAEEFAGGYTPLGTRGKYIVVWSIARKEVMDIAPTDLLSPATWITVCTNAWVNTHWVEYVNNVPQPIDYKAHGAMVADECARIGHYDAACELGAGVHRIDDNDTALAVNSKELFRTDGEAIKRISKEKVYKPSRDLGITPATVPATAKDVKQVLKTLSTWTFKRKSDPKLLIGWIAAAYLCGATSWRTHVSLTGCRGVGKSALVDLLAKLLGRAGYKADGGSSAAGIRQLLGTDSIAYLSDESEADAKHLAALLAFFRTASSGGTVLRGTQDQAGAAFTSKCVGLIAGIVRPMMNAADTSRFLMLELTERAKGTHTDLPFLAKDTAKARKVANYLGVKMFARMVKNWGRFLTTVDLVREEMRKMGDENRFADTLGTLIAAAHVMLEEKPLIAKNAKKWIEGFDLADAREQVATTADEVDLLDLIMSSTVSYDGMPWMISQLAQRAVGSKKCASSIQLLAQYGIRADRMKDDQISLMITPKNPQLQALLAKVGKGSYDVTAVLMRIKGAEKDSQRIGGKTCHGIRVPTPLTFVIDTKKPMTLNEEMNTVLNAPQYLEADTQNM